MDDLKRDFWYRLFEILPGAISWSILIFPIVGAFFFPRAVSVFIAVYILVWFFRSIKSSAFLIYSYYKSRKQSSMDWSHPLSFFTGNPPPLRTDLEKEITARIVTQKEQGLFKKWTDIYHVVIVATYKEDKEVLESSINAIKQVDFPLDRIIVVLATEERDHMRAKTNASYLMDRFKGVFGHFLHFMHPANVPGELAAKGANITYACKNTANFLKDRGVNFSDVIVTTLDADNRPHPTYFSNLTFHYLMEPKRDRRSYQPLAFFFNNIWDVPFANRLIALANTFWYLAESGESAHLFNASVYAQSLDTLVAEDFWSRQTIVEDLHQYWRTYFHFRGDHVVVPLFVPVYQDALQNRTYFTSLIGQYRQLRRWAWGASEIPYVLIKMWHERKHLEFWPNVKRFLYLFYIQLTWATAPIIIFFNNSIPTFFNPRFSNSVFAYNISQSIYLILTLMLIAIVVSLWVSMLSLPRPTGRFSRIRFFYSLLQWVLLPFVTLIYGAIPAIDAQTRLMLNKPLGFVVTEKVRKAT